MALTTTVVSDKKLPRNWTLSQIPDGVKLQVTSPGWAGGVVSFVIAVVMLLQFGFFLIPTSVMLLLAIYCIFYKKCWEVTYNHFEIKRGIGWLLNTKQFSDGNLTLIKHGVETESSSVRWILLISTSNNTQIIFTFPVDAVSHECPADIVSLCNLLAETTGWPLQIKAT